MNQSDKIALRTAAVICRRLTERQACQGTLQLPQNEWSQMQRLVRQIELAHKHHWHRAARILTEDLLHQADLYHYRLLDLMTILRQKTVLPDLPSQKDIFQEIQAIQDEFDQVDVDPKTGEICVTTNTIVLEGIRLGRFEIRLDWKSQGSSASYRVVALDPNPAARDDGVTHPHVQNECLCEGEGRSAVRAAIAQGRLCDFFLIVTQILATYARGSAHVELDQWEGQSCADCGYTVSEDNGYCCERCNNSLCSDCVTNCQGCMNDYCSDCISTCHICEGSYCQSCIDLCSECHSKTCPNCLQDGLCQECYEPQNEDDSDATDKQCQQASAGPNPQTGL